MHDEKTKVLIIDDEQAYTTLLKLNLEQTNKYEVVCENDSREAIQTALKWSPDIVLLDVVMPGPDGGDVAREMQDHPRLGRVPILFVTAVVNNRETHGEVIKMESGEQMLSKPFKLETLCDCIDEEVAVARATAG